MTAKKLAGYAALRNFDFNGRPVTGGERLTTAEMSAEDAAPFMAVGVVTEILEEETEGGADATAAGPADAPQPGWSTHSDQDD